ncbi:MAG TPA: hypothetical protein ENG66_07425 [Thermococcus sp.]|nr:hypothetical protein [Thermococcus sp.]
MSELICRCGFKAKNIEEMIKHVFTECGLENVDMKNEVARYNYYKNLVSFAVEDVLKRIAEGSFEIKDCHIDEFRSFWILLAMGLVEDKLFGTTAKDAQILIAKFVPELFVAIMEYAGIVKTEIKDGKIIVKKLSLGWLRDD